MFNWVADKINFNMLPSLLNSLSKDGFEIWQVKHLEDNTFLVIARNRPVIPPTGKAASPRRESRANTLEG